MPYYQDGQHIYWWDPNKRERRMVGVNLGDHVGHPGRPAHPRGDTEDPNNPPPPDPHHIRDTTVPRPRIPVARPPAHQTDRPQALAPHPHREPVERHVHQARSWPTEPAEAYPTKNLPRLPRPRSSS